MRRNPAIGVSGIVVNVVTTRHESLHAETGERVEIWRESLAIGNPLPTLPLWLGSDTALPLNLDLAYAAACRKLRIRELS